MFLLHNLVLFMVLIFFGAEAPHLKGISEPVILLETLSPQYLSFLSFLLSFPSSVAMSPHGLLTLLLSFVYPAQNYLPEVTSGHVMVFPRSASSVPSCYKLN